jgi:DNA polymerase III subunit beta
MIISLDKKILGEAVNIVSRFSERKVLSLPALSGMAIRAEKDSITLRATNLETGIELSVEGSVRAQGNVALPAAVFRDITSSLGGGGTISLETSGDTLVLSTEKGKSTIKTLSYEDMPTLSSPESSKVSFTLPGATLRALIGSVAGYASPSTVRPELASILISAEGGMVKAVATDSFRLAEKKVSVNGKLSPFSILIPAKNALDIMQVIPDTDIEVRADEHQCSFSFEKGRAVTRLVAMQYPDYQQIIPKSFSAEASVLKKDFESALRRSAVFSDSFQKVRLALDPKGKKLSLSARNADIGESSEDVAASVSGEALELSFNHRYLSAPLPNLVAESITLSCAGIGRPLVIRGQGDASFLYLVMPMNQ